MKYLFFYFTLLGISSYLISPTWGLEFSEVYQSVRGRTLGQAMTAKVYDATSLYYNPAGIGLSPSHLLIMDTQGSLSTALPEFITNVQQIAASADITNISSLTQAYLNQNVHADVSIMPFLFQKGNFASGLLMSSSNDFYVGPQLLPSIRVRSNNQIGATVGYAIGHPSGRIRVGIAGKILARAGIDLPMDSSNLVSNVVSGSSGLGSLFSVNALLQDNTESGILMDADIGLQGYLPIKTLAFKYGITVQNLMSQNAISLGAINGVTLTPLQATSYFGLERTLNVGVAISLRPSSQLETELSVDMRNLLRTTLDKTWGPRLGIGWETRAQLGQYVQIGLRLGLMNASYLCYGIFAKFLGMNFEVGQYSVELGGTTRQYEDARLLARFSFGW